MLSVLFEDVQIFANLNTPETFRILVDYRDERDWSVEGFEAPGANGGYVAIDNSHAYWRVYTAFAVTDAAYEQIISDIRERVSDERCGDLPRRRAPHPETTRDKRVLGVGGVRGVKISETLDKAADLIEPPGKWTWDVFARTIGGSPTGPSRENAHCFCLRGAVRHIEGHSGPADRFVRAIFPAAEQFNDAPERTQPEVVAKLREIAEQARVEGK